MNNGIINSQESETVLKYESDNIFLILTYQNEDFAKPHSDWLKKEKKILNTVNFLCQISYTMTLLLNLKIQSVFQFSCICTKIADTMKMILIPRQQRKQRQTDTSDTF